MTNTLIGKDVRHINEYIDAAHPEVKAYIENQEDFITHLMGELVAVLDGSDDVETQQYVANLKELIELDVERNARTRK